MPEISRFYGIVITMYYNDHNPPHFHEGYGADEAQVAIASMGILNGRLPPKAYALVVEWAARHQAELAENWQRVRASQPLEKIDPLQ